MVHVVRRQALEYVHRGARQKRAVHLERRILGGRSDEGEQAVLTSGADALVIRTAWLYGHHGKNFVKSIMSADRREPALRVVSDQRGCPTFAEDLASALLALMAKNVSGVIHVTNRGDCTWHEFAEAIVREMGLAVPVAPISTEAAGRVAKRPRFSVLNQER